MNFFPIFQFALALTISRESKKIQITKQDLLIYYVFEIIFY